MLRTAGWEHLILLQGLKEKVYIKRLVYLDIFRESGERMNILHGVVHSETHRLPWEEPLYVLTRQAAQICWHCPHMPVASRGDISSVHT